MRASRPHRAAWLQIDDKIVTKGYETVTKGYKRKQNGYKGYKRKTLRGVLTL